MTDGWQRKEEEEEKGLGRGWGKEERRKGKKRREAELGGLAVLVTCLLVDA
jgi:hypothetical protein